MSKELGPGSNPDDSKRPFPPFKRPSDVAGNFWDRMRNPSFGFLRLAQADNISAAARHAYDLRIHPDALDYKHELLATIPSLDPASLGQLAVLTRCNEMQGIFGQTEIEGRDELGLLVTVPYDAAPDSDVPDEEWCDDRGLPITVIHELTEQHNAIRGYELETEQAIIDAVEAFMPEDSPEMQIYFRAWVETAGQLAAQHSQIHQVLRVLGPICGPGAPLAPPDA